MLAISFVAALGAEAKNVFDLAIPHSFTSPDVGQTRCFDADHCYGPPLGGWAWEAEDIGKFDASAPLPPFDPNRPQPYRSRDGGQTRCFIGYGCKGPPSGGWLWPTKQAWYQKAWSWISDTVPPWSKNVGLPAANEAMQQALPDSISVPLSGVESSITLTQFLQPIEKDRNSQLMEIAVSGVCPEKTCSSTAIAGAADDLSNFPFMGTANISKIFWVADMTHAQYQSYVQTIVTEWAKQAGYRVP